MLRVSVKIMYSVESIAKASSCNRFHHSTTVVNLTLADLFSSAAIAVQNFLRSMQGNQAMGNQAQPQGQIFTTLADLLPPSTTIPWVDSLDNAYADNLLTQLPPVLLLLSQEADDLSSANSNSETAKAAMEALSLDQKKEILRKVLRSPQFSQSSASLTGTFVRGKSRRFRKQNGL